MEFEKNEPRPVPTDENTVITLGLLCTIVSIFFIASLVLDSAVPTGNFTLTLKSPLSDCGIISFPLSAETTQSCLL